MLEKEAESLKIHFGGEDSIEISTLVESLNSTVTCLKIIADETLDKDDHCKFVINNVQKGSFEIFISIIKDIIPYVNAIVPLGASIATIFTSIVQLRKHFRGKEPTEIININGGKNVKNVDGDVYFVDNPIFNLYVNNPEIEKELAKINKTVAEDKSRTELIVEEHNSDNEIIKAIKFDKGELLETSTAIDVERLADDLDVSTLIAWADIKRPCFIGETKWELNIQGKNCNVSIEDREFLSRVQAGEIKFGSTTKIHGEFTVKVRLSEDGKAISKARYSLVKVIEVKEQNEQLSLYDVAE